MRNRKESASVDDTLDSEWSSGLTLNITDSNMKWSEVRRREPTDQYE